MLETKVNIEDVKLFGDFLCVPSMLLFWISVYAITKSIWNLTSFKLSVTAKRRQCQIPSRQMLYSHAPCHPPPWVQTNKYWTVATEVGGSVSTNVLAFQDVGTDWRSKRGDQGYTAIHNSFPGEVMQQAKWVGHATCIQDYYCSHQMYYTFVTIYPWVVPKAHLHIISLLTLNCT